MKRNKSNLAWFNQLGHLRSLQALQDTGCGVLLVLISHSYLVFSLKVCKNELSTRNILYQHLNLSIFRSHKISTKTNYFGGTKMKSVTSHKSKEILRNWLISNASVYSIQIQKIQHNSQLNLKHTEMLLNIKGVSEPDMLFIWEMNFKTNCNFHHKCLLLFSPNMFSFLGIPWTGHNNSYFKVAYPAISVWSGKVKEPFWFLPLLSDFPDFFPFQMFFLFRNSPLPNFWANFSGGGALCCPIGYAYT